MKTEVVWRCLPLIRFGQNQLARHSERGKKTRQTEKEVGRQHQGMDRPGVCQVPEGGGGQRKLEETGCEVICDVPMTPASKGKVKVKQNPFSYRYSCCNQDSPMRRPTQSQQANNNQQKSSPEKQIHHLWRLTKANYISTSLIIV